MGIKDLYAVIKSRCPEVLTELRLEELFGLSVAVDISIFLNRYVKSAGPARWLDSFIVLLCTLKRHGIKPVCIFDGPNPPVEKTAERERRRAEAAKMEAKIRRGEEVARAIRERGLEPDLVEEAKILMGRKVDTVSWTDRRDVLACLAEVNERRSIQNQPIIPEYAEYAKRIISIMGFPYYQADGEAEALCCGLAVHGYVDGVLSEDTDVLAHGAPFLLSKIDCTNGKIVAVSYADVLAGMALEAHEFKDLCIMLGCDYNQRARGYPPDGTNRKKAVPLGAKGALAVIEGYRTIDRAEEEGAIEDVEPLKHARCRELLTPPGPSQMPVEDVVPFSAPVKRAELEAFRLEFGVGISLEYVLEAFVPTRIRYVGEDVDDIEFDGVVEDFA